MADVRPFRGLRFDPMRVDLSTVVCPPYDVVSPAEQEAYHERDPHNAIRIELGRGSTDPQAPNNRYISAAWALRSWRDQGILIQDSTPSFYLYEHRFTLDGLHLSCRGILAAGRLHDWTEGAVLPHEGTRAGPKQDRLALMQATQANVSPLWLLYADPEERIAGILSRAWDRSTDATATAGEETHSLRIVSDAEEVRAISRAFRGQPLYIADGHHRYETAQAYRDEQRRHADNGTSTGRAAIDAGYEFALFLLVSLDDPGLVVLPTHRLVRHLDRPLEDVRLHLARWLTLTPLSPPVGDPAQIGLAIKQELDVAGLDEHVFVLLEASGAWLLHPRDDVDWQNLLPAGHSAAWSELDVAILDALAIRGACGIRAEGESAAAGDTGHGAHGAGDRLAYDSDPASAVQAVLSGEAQQAYFLRPTRVQQVCAVAAAGDRMPPKSTYFYPKPVTGLVIHTLDGVRTLPGEPA